MLDEADEVPTEDVEDGNDERHPVVAGATAKTHDAQSRMVAYTLLNGGKVTTESVIQPAVTEFSKAARQQANAQFDLSSMYNISASLEEQ